jgi:hypothetical protein
MIKKTHFYYIVAGALLILLLILIALPQPDGVQGPTPPLTPNQPTPFNLPPLDNQQGSVDFTIDIPPVDIPGKLSIYQTNPPSLQPHEVASRLGLNQQPDVSTALNGTFYRWFEPDNGRLTIQTPAFHLYFQPAGGHQPGNPPPPTAQTAHQQVVNFLQSRGLYDDNLPLLLAATEYYRASGANTLPTESPNQANQIRLNYAYNLDNHPLFFSPQTLTSLSATINASGTINRLTLYIPRSISPVKEIDPIGLEAATRLLHLNQGTLVQVESTIVSEGDPDPNFSRATIDSFDVIYIYLEEAGLIKPAYRFIGSAPDAARTQVTYNITYLVPAATE